MPRNPELASYIRWSDITEVMSWMQWGYGVRIVFKMVCASPVGEQQTKQYWECVACDKDLNPIELGYRSLGQWPSNQQQTMAGLFLMLLYQLDGAMQDRLLWTEPAFARAPREGLGFTR